MQLVVPSAVRMADRTLIVVWRINLKIAFFFIRFLFLFFGNGLKD